MKVQTIEKVRRLVALGDLRISDHAQMELEEDGILSADVVATIGGAQLVEDYGDAARGPSVLILQTLPDGSKVHSVWGLPAAEERPAVLVTAYRPSPARWSDDFLQRRNR